MIYYGGRLFKPVSTKGSSDTNSDTIFKYEQRDDLLLGTYSGGNIKFGSLIGTIDERGNIDMRYHHCTNAGKIMTGRCMSEPEILPSGKIRLHEKWRWTCGDRSGGRSILEEI